MYKSDLTRPDLAFGFGFVNKSSGYEIRFVLSFTFLVSPCSRLVFSCLEFCLFLSCLVCLVSSCLVSSCPFLSCLMSSRSVLPCSVLSCLVLSCPLLSCPVLSCLVLSYPVLSCLGLFCPVLSCLISSHLVSSVLVLSWQTFLRDASQPEVLFLHSWAVVLHKFWGGGGGNVSKSVSIKTKQYKFASVKAY